MPSAKEYMLSICHLEQRLRMYRAEYRSVAKYWGDQTRPSPRTENAVVRELQAKVDELEQAYLQSKREADLLLSKIPPESATLLVQRYWEKRKMPALSREMFLSERQVYRRLDKAEAEFQTVLDELDAQKNCQDMTP